MIKFADYDIVFQELPSEVTLALNLSLCPNGCPGCHSAGLMEDIGFELDFVVLDAIIEKYSPSISAVCFMGGDNDKMGIVALASHVKSKHGLKVGWYSGQDSMPEDDSVFDYVKLGGYKQELGSLKSKTTNQRLYKKHDGCWQDITSVFWR